MENERFELQFSAAVLAGGRSSRMGMDKAFLRVGNDLLIERQLQCLRESGAAELLISGRTDVDYSSFPAKVVRDGQPDAGPLAGVAAALKASSWGLVFVLAVDMPRMTAAMIAKIHSRCKDAVGCVPFDDHGFQPLGAMYPVGLLPVAEYQLQIGRYSMHEFVERAISEGFIDTLQLDSAECTQFTNMNFPHEWAAMHR